MPPVIRHPYYDPVEGLDMSKPVGGVTVNAALRTGVDAKVILMGRPKPPPPGYLREWWPDWFESIDAREPRPVLFTVQVRPLLPGPELGPRDPLVTEWLRAHGWEKALEAAERRWFEQRDSGALQKQARGANAAAAVESERRRAEDAQRPGFFDEFVNQAGETLEGLYKAANEAAETVKEAFGFVKWGLIGTAAVVGVVAVARLTRERKRHG